MSGRVRLLLTILILALLGGGVGYWYSTRHNHKVGMEPPSIDWSGADTEVAAAFDKLRDEVRKSPQSPIAWGRLGLFLLAYGHSGPSRDCLAEAERLDPREPRWPYCQGVTLLSDEPEQALPKLLRTVELCGNVPDAPRLRLAEYYLERGQLTEAQAEFQKAIDQDPANARAHLGQARIERERDDEAKCLTHLEVALASNFSKRAAHGLIAEICRRRGDVKGANQELRLADEAPEPDSWPDPFQAEASRLLVGRQAALQGGLELLAAGRVDDAALAAEQATANYPQAALAWVLLGKARLQQNDFLRAEQALSRAVALDPGIVDAQFLLGTARFQLKQYASAEECFLRTTQLKLASASAYYNLGHCRKELGNKAGAIQAFREAVQLKPQHGESHRSLGDLLAQEGQFAAAEEHLVYAVELNPEDARAKERLAEVRKELAKLRSK